MILQINKVLKDFHRCDLLDGVKRTNSIMDDFVMVEFNNGDIFSYSIGETDYSFKVDSSQEMHDYTITEIWLLNDEGKTLSKLI